MEALNRSALSFALGVSIVFGIAGQVAAQTKIKLLYTAAYNYVAAYVAKDQDYFIEHGLDVDLSLAQNGGVIPPAVLSGSAQIGATTVTSLLQAVDQSLDFVVIAGSNVYTGNGPVQGGIVARAGSSIKDPQDLIGKKIGQSGFGGALDVLTRRWVKVHGLDPEQMQWLEIPFPRMSDSLKSGLVDVITVVDPFYTRIIDAQIGELIGDFRSIERPGMSLPRR